MRRRENRMLWLLLIVLLGCGHATVLAEPSAETADEGEPVAVAVAGLRVIQIARGYDDGGGYIWKNSTGVPDDLVFKGETILKKQPKGTYCCGFTLAVAFRFAQENGLLDELGPSQVKRFQKQWYGATEDSGETQCTLAMETLGIGAAVPHDEALPGDFGNFWRTKSGHSIIFLEWIETDGQRIGLRYRSSQRATDGVGDHEEYFQGHGGHVDPERLYLCRFHIEPTGDETAE